MDSLTLSVVASDAGTLAPTEEQRAGANVRPAAHSHEVGLVGTEAKAASRANALGPLGQNQFDIMTPKGPTGSIGLLVRAFESTSAGRSLTRVIGFVRPPTGAPSPAEVHGLIREGDVLVGVGSTSVVDKTFADVVAAIKAQEGPDDVPLRLARPALGALRGVVPWSWESKDDPGVTTSDSYAVVLFHEPSGYHVLGPYASETTAAAAYDALVLDACGTRAAALTNFYRHLAPRVSAIEAVARAAELRGDADGARAALAAANYAGYTYGGSGVLALPPAQPVRHFVSAEKQVLRIDRLRSGYAAVPWFDELGPAVATAASSGGFTLPPPAGVPPGASYPGIALLGNRQLVDAMHYPPDWPPIAELLRSTASAISDACSRDDEDDGEGHADVTTQLIGPSSFRPMLRQGEAAALRVPLPADSLSVLSGAPHATDAVFPPQLAWPPYGHYYKRPQLQITTGRDRLGLAEEVLCEALQRSGTRIGRPPAVRVRAAPPSVLLTVVTPPLPGNGAAVPPVIASAISSAAPQPRPSVSAFLRAVHGQPSAPHGIYVGVHHADGAGGGAFAMAPQPIDGDAILSWHRTATGAALAYDRYVRALAAQSGEKVSCNFPDPYPPAGVVPMRVAAGEVGGDIPLPVVGIHALTLAQLNVASQRPEFLAMPRAWLSAGGAAVLTSGLFLHDQEAVVCTGAWSASAVGPAGLPASLFASVSDALASLLDASGTGQGGVPFSVRNSDRIWLSWAPALQHTLALRAQQVALDTLLRGDAPDLRTWSMATSLAAAQGHGMAGRGVAVAGSSGVTTRSDGNRPSLGGRGRGRGRGGRGSRYGRRGDDYSDDDGSLGLNDDDEEEFEDYETSDESIAGAPRGTRDANRPVRTAAERAVAHVRAVVAEGGSDAEGDVDGAAVGDDESSSASIELDEGDGDGDDERRRGRRRKQRRSTHRAPAPSKLLAPLEVAADAAGGEGSDAEGGGGGNGPEWKPERILAVRYADLPDPDGEALEAAAAAAGTDADARAAAHDQRQLSLRLKIPSIAARRDWLTLEYLIRWKGLSYLHVEWVASSVLREGGTWGRIKATRYVTSEIGTRQLDDEEARMAAGREPPPNEAYFDEDFIVPERVIAARDVGGDGDEPNQRQYLVKWRGLPYAEATWEKAEDVSDDKKIAQFERFNTAPQDDGAAWAARPDPREYRPHAESPVFKGGRTLRDYQLEGLNWMVWNWFHRRNCILADEMGLVSLRRGDCVCLRRKCGVPYAPLHLYAPLWHINHKHYFAG